MLFLHSVFFSYVLNINPCRLVVWDTLCNVSYVIQFVPEISVASFYYVSHLWWWGFLEECRCHRTV